MNRTLSLASLALVTVAFVAACSGTAGQPPAPSSPVAAPVTTPVLTPSPAAMPMPVRSPAGPITVQLETATGHRVSIAILDDGHHVVAARSGTPGDGASVPFGSVQAKNVGPTTVQLTWSDTPGDAELGLYVSEDAMVVLVLRPERPAGDAIAFDRVLVVEFDRPVDAATLHLGVQEGLDTAG